MTDIHEAACSFCQLAERFCDAVEKKSVSAENAAEWLSLLMELYTKAMALPEVEPDDESISYEKNAIPQRQSSASALTGKPMTRFASKSRYAEILRMTCRTSIETCAPGSRRLMPEIYAMPYGNGSLA